MSQDHPAATLTLRLLPDADLEQADQLRAVMTPEVLLEGDIVIEQGATSEGLWFVNAGALSVHVGSDGGLLEVARVEPGHWVGEVALLDPGPASATVKAAEPTELWHLSPKDLEQLRADAPLAALEMLQTLSRDLVQRVRSTDEHLREQLGIEHPEPKPGLFGGALSRLFGGRA
jgi:CRP/FNR family cyclic AMP-dependent transcriptional regulator